MNSPHDPILRMALRHLGYPEDMILVNSTVASYYPEAPSASPMTYIVTVISERKLFNQYYPEGMTDTVTVIDVVKLTLIDGIVIHHTLHHGFDGIEFTDSVPGPDDDERWADLYNEWEGEEYGNAY